MDYIVSPLKVLSVVVFTATMSHSALSGIDEEVKPLPNNWIYYARVSGAYAQVDPTEPAPGGGTAVHMSAPANSDPQSEGSTVRVAQMKIDQLDKPCVANIFARGARTGQNLIVFFYTDPVNGKHWYVRKELPLTTDWKKLQIVTNTPADPVYKGRPMYLHLRVVDGDMWVTEATLATVTSGSIALAADEGAAVPSARKNLLDNPGFDIGGSGWLLQNQFVSSAIDGTRFPEVFHDNVAQGTAAMHMFSKGMSLVTPLYPYKGSKTYTLSLYMRAGKEVPAQGDAAKFYLITPKWNSGGRPVSASELGSDWRRFSFSFTPPNYGSEMENRFYVRIDSFADVDVDSVQLEEAPEASVYDQGLQVGLEPVAPDGILPKGPASLSVIVNIPDDVKAPLELRVKATNVTGRVLYEKTTPLPAAAKGRHEIRLKVAHREEGIVNMALTLAPVGGHDPSLAAVRGNFRYAVFDPSDPAPNPLVGTDDGIMNQTLASFEKNNALAQRLGLGFRRACLGDLGDHGNDEGSKWLEKLRILFNRQRPNTPFAMIGIDPTGSVLDYQVMVRRKSVPTEEEFTAALPAYKALVAKTVKALSGDIDYIESFNEVNIWTVERQQGMPPERYARVLAATREALKEISSDVKLAANVNGIDIGYLSKLGAAGGLAYVDMVTVHPYRSIPESPAIFDELKTLRALLDQYSPGIKIYNSEQYFGVRNQFSGNPSEFKLGYFGENEEDIAGRILQTSLHGLAYGAGISSHSTQDSLWIPTAFGSPWWYQAAGGMRALSRISKGVIRGHDVPVNDAVRVILFEKQDGELFASINARLFELSGKMTLPKSNAGIIFDVNGNPQQKRTIHVGYTPIYVKFAKGTAVSEAIEILHAAAWSGFASPLDLKASRNEDGSVRIVASNREKLKPLAGKVHWLHVPAELSAIGKEWAVDLPAGGKKELTVATSPIPWRSEPELTWEATAGEKTTTGRLRIPSILVPRLPEKMTAAQWEPKHWYVLSDQNLAANPNPEHPRRDAKDLSARVAFSWNAQGLHLVAQVSDDIVMEGSNEEGYQYTSDSLQLYVDQRLEAKPGTREYGSYESTWCLGHDVKDSALVWLERSPGNRFVGAFNATTGPDPVVRAAWKRTNEGWECRATFPPETLSSLEFRAGSTIGLSLLINDNDGQGRKQGLTLGKAGTEPHLNPWLWKRCQLVDTLEENLRTSPAEQ